MIKLSKKRPTSKDGNSWMKSGMFQGFAVSIEYNAQHDCYFYSTAKNGYVNSSKWDGITFKTEEECTKALEEYVRGNING